MLFLMFRCNFHPFKKPEICKKIITFMLESITETK